MWTHFAEVNFPPPMVGKIIGGKVEENIQIAIDDPQHGFKNACAIRMSYALHHSGTIIENGAWKAVSGADKRRYIYRVEDMKKFLHATFGNPDKAVQNPVPRDFANMRGILTFTKHFGDACRG